MKSAATRVLACALLAAESSILLREANSLQSWGDLVFLAAKPAQEEARAEEAAKEIAAWMPPSRKHPHRDLEVERLEYKVRQSHVGAVRPRSHARSQRAAALSRDGGEHKAKESESRPEPHRGAHPVADWFAHSRPSRHKAIHSAAGNSEDLSSFSKEFRAAAQEFRAAAPKPLSEPKPVLSGDGSRDGAEATSMPMAAASTSPAAGSSSEIGRSSTATPQSAFARRAFGEVHGTSSSYIIADFLKELAVKRPLPNNIARAGAVVSDATGQQPQWKPAEMHSTSNPPDAKKQKKAAIPLNVSSSASEDEGPEVAQTIRRQDAKKQKKAEIPLKVASSAGGDEGPEVAQMIRRVAGASGANANRELQKPMTAPGNVMTPASLPTTAIPLTKSPSNHSANEATALACVCNGTFNEGDRVKYTGHSYPPGRTFGTVLGGTGNGFLNVEWDNWSAGHAGNCKFTTCGSCTTSSVLSRWFTECGGVDLEHHLKTVTARPVPAIATAER